MIFKIAFIRSKVARRVLWLFFLSSLVPIGATAFYSFTYVTSQLEEQSFKQLQQASKLYGMALLDRLLNIDNRLGRLTAMLENVGQNQQSISDTELQRLPGKANLENQVDKLSLEWLPTTSLEGKPGQANKVNTAELYSRSATGEVNAEMYLRRMTTIQQGDRTLTLVARLNKAYLWGDENRLPFSTFLCILDANGKVLFCPGEDHTALVEKVRAMSGYSDSRNLVWTNRSGKNLAVAWELFINSNFNGPNWKIISSREESVALLPVYAYHRIFPLLFLLSLLMVLLLSLIQVRRIMFPLEKLVNATRRLARYEFDEPVRIETRDEFRELGDSFNTMAARLEKQFNALRVLSEIDRLILSYPDLDVVLTKIFDTVHKIIVCDYIAITLFDRTDTEFAWTHIKKVADARQASVEKTSFDPENWNRLKYQNDIEVINLKDHPIKCLQPLVDQGVTVVQVCPIVLEGNLRAVFSLGYCDANSSKVEDNGLVRDIIDRLAVALATADRDEKLYQQVHFDFLTGLPNRQLFYDRLEQHIIRARRAKSRAAVLYIALDRIKKINDSLGHASGDKLLRLAATRMKECVRETDTVSRLGGDEFVILLSSVSSPRDAGYIAEHLISEISKPYTLQTKEVYISASVGIVIYPDDGSDNRELMAHADAAMYHAKEGGGGQYKFFEESMNKELIQRIEMENAMRHALERGEFSLCYQPQIATRNGHVTAMEALIRWNHPVLGMVKPGAFIPLAEECGLIEPIGEWVLHAACNQFQAWRKKNLAPARLAVNISSRQFMRENFLDIVEGILAKTGMRPQELELEITESLLLDEGFKVKSIFNRLSNIGVQLAIDDFGTGYSSLGYLKRFSVQTLKIDRAFSRDIPLDKQATTLTLSIISMAHALNMQVVAEGIETKAQLELLREHDCDYVQGNFFSQPLTAEQMERYLELAGVGSRASYHG